MGRRFCFLVVICALVASLGCASDSTSAPVSPTAASTTVASGGSSSGPVTSSVQPSLSPEAVIRDYWLAVGRHDRKAMDDLSSTYLRQETAGPGSNWPDKSIKYDMSKLKVGNTRPCDLDDLRTRPDRYLTYHAVREGTVEYVQLNDSDTNSPGHQLRFVTVVQETSTSPWRVEEIGTGP